ncbi:hypothetical protein BASA81_000945 [Batrachochytrium salamandrivorans]|nr:hypothetical protein BASA81_000945 [Batrachochytrium salamandrivorans]
MAKLVLLRPGGEEEGGVSIQVAREVACMSTLIKDMLEDDDPESTPEIPLPNVHRRELTVVLEFCHKHCNDPMLKIPRPLPSSDLSHVVSEWDVEFCTRNSTTNQDLFDLILAANYLDIPDLLMLGCAKLTTMIKDKTPEEIKQLFATPDQVYAADDEERIRKENPWIFDLT